MKFLEKLAPVALLVLRLGLGLIFIYHGYPKLFTHSRDSVEGFIHMGFPGYFSYVAGVVEFFGGVLLAAGLFTRPAALLLTAEMAVAIWKVHLPQGSVLTVQNYQFPLACGVGAFTLAALGAGIFSLDAIFFPSGRK